LFIDNPDEWVSLYSNIDNPDEWVSIYSNIDPKTKIL
jgi:hypothetical protein